MTRRNTPAENAAHRETVNADARKHYDRCRAQFLCVRCCADTDGRHMCDECCQLRSERRQRTRRARRELEQLKMSS